MPGVKKKKKPRNRKFVLRRVLESKEPERRDPAEYRRLIQEHYDGPAGWFTLITGFLTGHESLADNVLGPGGFDVSGCRCILDAGCGNGRYTRFLLKQADPEAILVACDLSIGMLRRARRRLKSDRPELLCADLTQLPFADASFDAIVCGWVLEHMQEPVRAIREIARVLTPNGKALLMTTESTLSGAIVSRCYHSRTMTRQELRAMCQQCRLVWHREYWWSKLHRLLRAGGIVVELRKPAD